MKIKRWPTVVHGYVEGTKNKEEPLRWSSQHLWPLLSGPLVYEHLCPRLRWEIIHLDSRLMKLAIHIDALTKTSRFYFTPGSHPKASQEVFCMVGVQLQGSSHKPLSLSNTVCMIKVSSHLSQATKQNQAIKQTWIEPITPINRNGSSFMLKGMLKYLTMGRSLWSFQLGSHFAVLVSRSMKPYAAFAGQFAMLSRCLLPAKSALYSRR